MYLKINGKLKLQQLNELYEKSSYKDFGIYVVEIEEDANLYLVHYSQNYNTILTFGISVDFLDYLVDDMSQTSSSQANSNCSSSISEDTLLKAIAISQRPDLIKDL